jgi:hypothetical protein
MKKNLSLTSRKNKLNKAELEELRFKYILTGRKTTDIN